jgi:hypothetical protein
MLSKMQCHGLLKAVLLKCWLMCFSLPLALAFDGGVCCQNHALAALSLKGERDPGIHLPGGWVGLKADMDVVVKELNLVASVYAN